MKEARRTLKRVCLIIWGLGALIVLVGLVIYFFCPHNMLSFVLGAIGGCGASTVLMIHRFSSISVEVDMEKSKSITHSRMMATFRTIISIGVLMIAFIFPHIMSPWSVFFGLFATKIAAIAYPFIFRETSVENETVEEKNERKE